ncbi:MAG: hypothetical protein ACKV2T_36025 [Kofleriaceae bacterium]
MKKLTFRVSGARAGDDVRPASEIVVDVVESVAPRASRFGLRPRAPFVAPAPKPAVALTADDYATLEDYT